jgi:hypothetical protein
MDHLVPQLSSRLTPAGSTGDEPAAGGTAGPPADLDDGARRSRHALGALQRGTRDARRSDEGSGDGGEDAR